MKWFKHDADASSDAKIKKLLIRHGAVGYAIYFHCLELIASDIGETNINFELEHDSEIIADNLKIKGTADKSGVDIVNEIMRYIIDLGLFECHNDKVFCFKMLKRLDSSMTSNPKMRRMIKSAKDSHDSVMTGSCKTRLEETRKEETRKEENTGAFSAENQETDRNYSRELETLKEYWNSQGLPEFRKSLMNISNIQEIMDVLRVYSFEEAKKAIENYADIKQTRERAIVYSTFPNFIERGVEKYADSSKPYENIGRDKYTGPAVASAPAESTQEEIDQIWGL